MLKLFSYSLVYLDQHDSGVYNVGSQTLDGRNPGMRGFYVLEHGWNDGTIVPLVHFTTKSGHTFTRDKVRMLEQPMDASVDPTLREVIVSVGIPTAEELTAAAQRLATWVSKPGTPSPRGRELTQEEEEEIARVFESLGVSPIRSLED